MAPWIHLSNNPKDDAFLVDDDGIPIGEFITAYPISLSQLAPFIDQEWEGKVKFFFEFLMAGGIVKADP